MAWALWVEALEQATAVAAAAAAADRSDGSAKAGVEAGNAVIQAAEDRQVGVAAEAGTGTAMARLEVRMLIDLEEVKGREAVRGRHEGLTKAVVRAVPQSGKRGAAAGA